MTIDAWIKLEPQLAMLPGYPAWSDAMKDAWFAALADVPDAAVYQMARELLCRFDTRPVPKTLRDWAHTLLPRKPFDIADISDRALPAPQSVDIPPHVKQMMAGLRQRLKTEMKSDMTDGVGAGCPDAATAGEYGLVYTDTEGKREWMPAQLSKDVAERKAEAFNAKFSHKQAAVYHRAAGGNVGDALREMAGAV